MTNLKPTHRFLVSLSILAASIALGLYAHNAQAQFRFTFTADPTWIAVGEYSTLQWSAPDQSCRSSDFPASGDFGRVRVYPRVTTTYDITCGSQTKSVTVKVTADGPPPPTTASMAANPSSVVRGNTTALTWSSNGTSCTGTNFSTGGAADGTASVGPQSGTLYSISCTGPGGSATASTWVNVTEPQFDASCTVDEDTATVGETVRWTASAWNGTSPYTYEWLGEAVSGLTGSSISVSYDSPGEKNASVTVTDSANLGAGMWTSITDNRRCTGPAITGNLRQGVYEDGGRESDMEALIKHEAKAVFEEGNSANYSEDIPPDIYDNPENYCVEANLKQECDPDDYIFGAGTCNFSFRITVHQGSGVRSLTYDDGDYLNGWNKNRYFGTARGEIRSGSPRTLTRACSATVTVNESIPTATLSASPISITEGDASTLSSRCTNATSASINQGVGAVSATAYDTSVVRPTANTTYTLTCTGPGGTARDTVTVSVTPRPVPLTGSCSVSPTSITTGGSATWTARASGGVGSYRYSWSGTDSLYGYSSSVSKRYTTPGSKTARVTITSGTESIAINCSNSLTVSEPPEPDLTAGAISPTTAVAGTAVALRSTVRNGGNATAAAYFYTLFQRATSSSGAGATDIGTYRRMSTVAVNGSFAASRSYAFPSAGSWYVRACADKSASWNGGIISESNENNNCGPWTLVTVSEPPEPDLTAGAVAPTTAVAGTAVALRSTVRNGGNATAAAYFYTLFQRATSSSGAGATDIGTYRRMSTVAAGSSFTASDSYTFPSAGTWYARACADKSASSNGGIIDESNENNNCGPWTRITVSEPAPTGSLSCSVSDASPAPGTYVTYTVSPSGGASGPYDWDDSQGGSYGTGSSVSRFISGAGPYVMRVDGDNVITPDTCPVVSGVCANPSAEIEASPDRVREGETTTITWSASGVDSSCVITGTDGYSRTMTPSSCVVGNTSVVRTITAQTVFRISCDNGESVDEVIVNLIPKFIEF